MVSKAELLARRGIGAITLERARTRERQRATAAFQKAETSFAKLEAESKEAKRIAGLPPRFVITRIGIETGPSGRGTVESVIGPATGFTTRAAAQEFLRTQIGRSPEEPTQIKQIRGGTEARDIILKGRIETKQQLARGQAAREAKLARQAFEKSI